MLPPDHPHRRQYLREMNDNQRHVRHSPSKSLDASVDDSNDVGLGKRIRSSKTFKSILEREKKLAKQEREHEKGDQKVKKSKSSTSLSARFLRPGSSKGREDQNAMAQKDKENQTPPETPIWAQFMTDQNVVEASSTTKVPLNDRRDLKAEVDLYTPRHYSPSKQRNFGERERPTLSRRCQDKSRPKSECLSSTAQTPFSDTVAGMRRPSQSKAGARSNIVPSMDSSTFHQTAAQKPVYERTQAKANPPALTVGKRGSRVMAAVAAFNGKSKDLPKAPAYEPSPEELDPKAIEYAFESLLVSPAPPDPNSAQSLTES